MQDLNDLYYFAQVVEHHGFAAAGRALSMPRSKLSRRIAILEDRLGVRLIQRSTRQFSVTEIGQEYYRHCLAVLVEVDAAQEAIDHTRAEPRGLIRVSGPVSIVQYQLGDMIARFLKAYPGVQVYLESTNRRVDVVAEGFDIALSVRYPPPEESDLVMRPIGEAPQGLMASPDLMKGRAMPNAPTELEAFPTLDWGSSQEGHAWHLVGPADTTFTLNHTPRLVTSDVACLRFAALRGIGVANLPLDVASKDLLRGALVRILPEWSSRTAIVYARFASRRGMLPSVRALIDYLVAEFKATDRADADSLGVYF